MKSVKSGANVKVKVRRLDHAKSLPLPVYQTAGSAGLDLTAAIPDEAPVRLAPGARALIPTGLVLELPKGFEAQVRPRSGLAAKFGVTVLNSPGTIDSDYRGEVAVILINLGTEPFEIARGDRIAQAVIAPVSQARLIEVKTLGRTTRGPGGFGSTGIDTRNKGGTPTKRRSTRSSAAPRGPKRAG